MNLCKNGHDKDLPGGMYGNYGCRVCARQRTKDRYHANPIYQKTYLKVYRSREENKPKQKESGSRWRKKNPERNKELMRNWYYKNKETQKWKTIKRLYGITKEQYDVILSLQNNICPICLEEIPENDMAVDHDHTTGEVRGIVHHVCNLGLGGFRDNPDNCRRAAEYLEGRRRASSRA